MSRYLGYGFGREFTGDAADYRNGFFTPVATPAQILRDPTLGLNRQNRKTLMQADTTRYAGSHKGLMSFKDGAQLSRDLLDKMASQQYAGDNAEGILKLAVLDRRNQMVPNTPFELGGKTFRTNGDGFARLVDAERLNIELEAHNQIEEYELKILKAIMISDDMALRMLDETVFNKLGPRGAPEGIDTPEIVNVDARPDKIKFMDPSSVEYNRALVKLKAAVKEAGVILNEENQNLQSATHHTSPAKQQEVKGTP